MGKFLAAFWATAVSLGGLVGLYIGALQIHVVWVFWATLVISVAVAFSIRVGPQALEMAVRFRNYPALLRRVGEIEEELREKDVLVTEQREAMQARYDQGLQEGRRQVLGSLYSNLAGHITLSGVVIESDRLYLVADFNSEDNIVIGARYNVRHSINEISKGIVEVQKINEDRSMIYLACIEASSPDFWEKLAERAELDSSPPMNIVIVPSDIPQIEESAL